jgi:hypothetical protein
MTTEREQFSAFFAKAAPARGDEPTERQAVIQRWSDILARPVEAANDVSGKELRQLRQACGLDSALLAHLLGVHEAQILRAEDGSGPTPEALAKFATVARVAVPDDSKETFTWPV